MKNYKSLYVVAALSFMIVFSLTQSTAIAQAVNQGGALGGSSSHFFSVGVRAGVAIPHGDINDFFDPNIAATADLEYHATDHFSIGGLFGYRRFSGPFSSAANIYQISGHGKFYPVSNPIRPFVIFGGGAYVFDSGTTKFGMHVGGGLQFRIWPKTWIETEYKFHNVFTSGSNVRFSTLQGGVRFRF